jgi:dehydratase ilvD1
VKYGRAGYRLDVDENSVLVLKGCGPRGCPGMPEVGNMPLPRKLLERGVKDMVRISDARMSGTAFGTVVLHVAPESEAGGPLALYIEHITQADRGCDLDFLVGSSGSTVERESH